MEPIESSLNFGVAKLKSEYDSQDRVTYMCATDKNGKKLNASYGFAEAFFSYDSDMYEAIYLDSDGNIVNNYSLNDPYAYIVFYMTETGQRVFSKTLKLSLSNDKETIREAYCFDKQNENIQKAIRQEDWQVQVYDVTSNRMNIFYSFEDEYDEYVHIVDSIQNDIEMKYGKPKLINMINH